MVVTKLPYSPINAGESEYIYSPIWPSKYVFKRYDPSVIHDNDIDYIVGFSVVRTFLDYEEPLASQRLSYS